MNAIPNKLTPIIDVLLVPVKGPYLFSSAPSQTFKYSEIELRFSSHTHFQPHSGKVLKGNESPSGIVENCYATQDMNGGFFFFKAQHVFCAL